MAACSRRFMESPLEAVECSTEERAREVDNRGFSPRRRECQACAPPPPTPIFGSMRVKSRVFEGRSPRGRGDARLPLGRLKATCGHLVSFAVPNNVGGLSA